MRCSILWHAREFEGATHMISTSLGQGYPTVKYWVRLPTMGLEAIAREFAAGHSPGRGSSRVVQCTAIASKSKRVRDFSRKFNY